MNFRKEFWVIFLAAIVLFPSCSIEKRIYNRGLSVESLKWRHNTKSRTENFSRNRTNSDARLNDEPSFFKHKIPMPTGFSEETSFTQRLKMPTLEPSIHRRPVQAKRHLKTAKDSSRCDYMLLMNGDEMNVRILAVGMDSIQFHQCDSTYLSIHTIHQKEVFMVKYASGTKVVFAITQTIKALETPVTEGLGITALTFSLFGMTILGLFLGPLAMLFGTISLTRIRLYPRRFKGKKLAWAAIIIGATEFLILLALIFSGIL